MMVVGIRSKSVSLPNEGGAKQLLLSVQKYIIVVQHDNETFKCKKEE